jgi:hypothetical protein
MAVPVLTGLSQLADGSFRFAYTNTSAQGYSVHASTNLIDWTSIGSATPVSPGWYQFADASATNYPRRFYQLRSP